ncbi:MAG TPA: carboxypeptidase regulatory-like domain-containing protein [Bryobacteraceae bacterium]
MIRTPWPLLALLIPLSALSAQDFSGTVLEDASSEPIPAAEVKVHKTGARELIADLDTDKTGHFAASGLPSGEYTIDVLKPNHLTTSFPIRLPAPALRVRMMHYAVLDGHVTNPQGEPVEGIVRAPYGQTIGATRLTVLAQQPGSDEFHSIKDATVDAKGHFRFFDLPPGGYELALWYYGIPEGSGMKLYPDNANPRIFTVAGGEVYNNLNFLITPSQAHSISGSIASPAPKDNKFSLALTLPDQPILPVSIALTDDNGAFHFDNIPPGAYDLLAAGPESGYNQFESILNDKVSALFGRVRVQVGGSDIANLAVPLTPAKSLSLVLRAQGGKDFPAACPRSARVTVSTAEPWGLLLLSSATVSATKEATIANLPPGKIRIVANDLGAGCYQTGDLVADLSGEVSQPVAVEVAAAGSIEGTLQKGAEPTAAYAIVLLDSSASPENNSHLAYPDAQGHFAFPALRPGHYRIAAGLAAEGARSRWLKNVSDMKEIEVRGGAPTAVDLARPAAPGGEQ